jgi:hypothetical protein
MLFTMDAAPIFRAPAFFEQAGRARADTVRVQIRNSIGCPVEGQNFFNRDEEQAHLWRRLDADHVLLLAPRRVGKTSLLYRLEATAERHDFKSIYVSVASHSTEVALLRALIEKVAEPGRFGRRLVSGASKLLQRIKSLSVSEVSVELEAHQWQDIGDDFLRILQGSKQRCLVMLDELPIFVLNLLQAHGRERVRLFLNWFRHVRLDRQARLAVRWLICGSIGLDTVTQRERLGDTINDLAIVRLDAFSRAHARALLVGLAHNYGIELRADVHEHMLDKIGWLIPYHLQLLFSAVRDLGDATPSIGSVDRAYAGLLANHHKGYFDPWYQRLRDELGPIDEGHALALLEAAANDSTGAPTGVLHGLLRKRGATHDLSRYILGVLVNDGYLVNVDDRWRFRSPLLRDYWRSMVLA